MRHATQSKGAIAQTHSLCLRLQEAKTSKKKASFPRVRQSSAPLHAFSAHISVLMMLARRPSPVWFHSQRLGCFRKHAFRSALSLPPCSSSSCTFVSCGNLLTAGPRVILAPNNPLHDQCFLSCVSKRLLRSRVDLKDHAACCHKAHERSRGVFFLRASDSATWRLPFLSSLDISGCGPRVAVIQRKLLLVSHSGEGYGVDVWVSGSPLNDIHLTPFLLAMLPGVPPTAPFRL